MSYLGEDIKKLGFGLMRLPKLEDGKTIDHEQVKVMVDKFMAAGCTYFDTAYVYDGGLSEAAAKECLITRYPRESFTIATKLNAGFAANTEEEAKQQFWTSKERLGVDYIDFYLLHALGDGNIEKYEKFHLFEYQQELKAKGLIKHAGFSFHGSPECLEKILTDHPEAEFVQLQINYVDWDDSSVQSEACYKVARKHNVPVVVMEPVKGGALANPPKPVADILQAANPEVSLPSWAIRFVASQDGILTVLSGMSNIAQMDDNLSYMADFQPLSEEEQELIVKAREAYKAIPQIPCTGCSYCTAGCPMQINIPQIFAARNQQMIWGNIEGGKMRYARATAEGGKASDCLECGQCEGACPQGLQIIELLKDCVENLE